jgi:hypothetical protein
MQRQRQVSFFDTTVSAHRDGMLLSTLSTIKHQQCGLKLHVPKVQGGAEFQV